MTRVVVDEETETDVMIAFVLMSDPEQVGITRFLARAALEYRELGEFADDAETIISEFVTNAIQHAAKGISDKICVTLMHVWHGEGVAVVVTGPSPAPPVMRQCRLAKGFMRALCRLAGRPPPASGANLGNFALSGKKARVARAKFPRSAKFPRYRRRHKGGKSLQAGAYWTA
jgi:hypothetical protein